MQDLYVGYLDIVGLMSHTKSKMILGGSSVVAVERSLSVFESMALSHKFFDKEKNEDHS